jgi:hypothetical protein
MGLDGGLVQTRDRNDLIPVGDDRGGLSASKHRDTGEPRRSHCHHDAFPYTVIPSVSLVCAANTKFSGEARF